MQMSSPLLSLSPKAVSGIAAACLNLCSSIGAAVTSAYS